MQATCPECQKQTELPIPKKVACDHCQADLNVKKLVGKRLIPIWTILVAGAYGGHKLDDWFEGKRLPMKEEFAVMETCVHGSGIFRSMDLGMKKVDTCACALEKSVAEFEKAGKDSSVLHGFGSIFSDNVKHCQ